MKIAFTDFVLNGRHFDPAFAGTKILDRSPDEFLLELQRLAQSTDTQPGYADFCVHLIVPNFTDARAGTMKISEENRHALRSGYKARRESELPVLGRWFEGLEAPRAEYLDIILYSRAKLQEEGQDIGEADWGICAILGLLEPREDPMPPATMVRNALGTAEGGSGMELDREKYLASVEFWEQHATVV